MTIEQFMRLVQLVGNSFWVRHYLANYPGQMVLEIANIDGEQLDQIRADLSHHGFRELPQASMTGVALHRFAVKRSDNGNSSEGATALDPVDAYRATVAMLMAHARHAKQVSHEEVLEIAAMSQDELRRRAVVARDWHRLFSMSLDGLPELQALGAPPDGCWFPRDIRRVVELLLARVKK